MFRILQMFKNVRGPITVNVLKQEGKLKRLLRKLRKTVTLTVMCIIAFIPKAHK